MQIHASRPRRGWLLLAVLLPLLCLAGCTARTSPVSPVDAPLVAPSPATLLPVATFTPVPTPSPTFTQTPTPTPTLLPTPTPTSSPTPTSTPTVVRPATPTPSLTTSGAYDNLTEHPDGRYALQRAGTRVAARFIASRAPVQHWARDVTEPLFIVPEGFRPPYAILRSAEGTPVRGDGTPDPDRPEPRRFLLRVDPDGSVHYVDDDHVEGVGHLAYSLDTVWGTTPAANDRAVLAILDAHWFGKTLLSAQPPLAQFEIPAREIRSFIRETLPAAILPGPFATFDADGRVTALDPPAYHFQGSLPPELGQLHRLEHLDLGYRKMEAHAAWTEWNETREHGRRPRGIGFGGPEGAGALTGPLPPQLGQLSRLRYLDLQGHLLTGPLPPQLGRLASLEYLNLHTNWLTGSLPPELGQLPRLQHLDLAGNGLTPDSLPPEMGDLASLESLDLSGNLLTALPPNWAN